MPFQTEYVNFINFGHVIKSPLSLITFPHSAKVEILVKNIRENFRTYSIK